MNRARIRAGGASRRRLGWLVAVTAVLWAPPLLGQDLEPDRMTFSVDRETFFDDDPAWILGLRPALGWGNPGETFPQLGLVVGKAYANHAYLGGYLATRLTSPEHLRAGLRTGAFFRRLRFSVASGTSLGVLGVPRRAEVGVVATWWAEAQYKLSTRHFLTAFAEVDMLYKPLGFHETRTMPSVGLGWSVTF